VTSSLRVVMLRRMPDEKAHEDEQVDEAILGSFPASDPPPWTLGVKPHPEAPPPLPQKEKLSPGEKVPKTPR
jgi:hypothetical protein